MEELAWIARMGEVGAWGPGCKGRGSEDVTVREGLHLRGRAGRVVYGSCRNVSGQRRSAQDRRGESGATASRAWEAQIWAGAVAGYARRDHWRKNGREGGEGEKNEVEAAVQEWVRPRCERMVRGRWRAAGMTGGSAGQRGPSGGPWRGDGADGLRDGECAKGGGGGTGVGMPKDAGRSVG